jgi:hypothetical protein
MGKRIIISEEEIREIKKLHNLQEGWADDAIEYIKDKGESLVDFVKDIFTDDEEDDEEKSTKEKEKDAEEKIKDLEGKDKEEFEKELEKDGKFNSDIVEKSDKEFYKKILDGINAPHTDENFKFLYAWRKGESTKARNNPFATTKKGFNGTSVPSSGAGVKNYKTPQDGIDATVATLKNGHYNCIVDGLKNNIGAANIAKCSSDLKTWGTGDLVVQVIKGGVSAPPKINNTTDMA